MPGMRAFLVFVCAALLAAQEPLPADRPIVPLELGTEPSPTAIAEALGVPVVALGENGHHATRVLLGPALHTPTTLRELLAAAAHQSGSQLVWMRDGAVAVLQPAEDAAVVAAVMAGLRDPAPAVRLRAAWRAGFVRDAWVVDGLLAARADADAEVRSQARHSLRRFGWAEAATIGGPAALPVLEAALREACGLTSSRRWLDDELREVGRRAAPPPPPARTAPSPDERGRPYVHWPLCGDAIDQAWIDWQAARLLDTRPQDARQAVVDVLRRHPAIPVRTRAVAWRAATVGWWIAARNEFAGRSGMRSGRHAAMLPPECALHLAIGQWEEALAALWAASPDPALSRAVAGDDRTAAVQRLRPLLAAWGAGDGAAEGHGLAMLLLLGGNEAVGLLEPWLVGGDASRRMLAEALLRRIDDVPARTRLAVQPPQSPAPPVDLLAVLRDEPAVAELDDPNAGLDADVRGRLTTLLARCSPAELRAAFAALQDPGERFALRKVAIEIDDALPIDIRMEVLERAMRDSHVQLRAIAGVAYVGLAGLPHRAQVLALADDRHHAIRMHSLNFSRNLIEELAEDLVVRAASDPHPQVREAVINRLGDLDQQRLHTRLLARVQDAGDAGRAGVAALLITRAVAEPIPLPPAEATALHAVAATSPDAEMRAVGADALRWCAWVDDAPTPAMQRALADADALVVGRATAAALLADAQRGAASADRLLAAAETRTLLGFIQTPGLVQADRARASRAATALVEALMAGGDRKLGARALTVLEEGGIPLEDAKLAAFQSWLHKPEDQRPPSSAPPPGDF